MTTKAEISEWFDDGLHFGSTHMLVVCDTFNHEDYPVHATSADDALRQFSRHDGPNMQRVMEVYDLNADKAEQLAEHRTMRLPIRKA